MSRRRSIAAAVAVAALALLVAACGSSSSSPSSTTAKRVNPTAPLTVASTTTSSTTAAKRSTTTTTTSTSLPAPTTVAASASTQATAPPPTPSGTPPAPNGLARTTGYGMYENCSTHCSGAVPATLRRALHLPSIGAGARCPVSSARGPVAPQGPATLRVTSFIGSSWDGAQVTWSAAASVSGPILIRGRELGRQDAVGFGEGHVPYDELQLYAGGSRTWQTFTRVRGPGCFAYQVDTLAHSSVFVFAATNA
jgi:hypothetical protein